MTSKYTTIGISRKIKKKLDKFRSPGQSYDGAVEELLDIAAEKAEVQTA